MRVAIVHDDLVQCGGAERVLEGLCEIFPDAPIYTSVFNRNNSQLQRRFGSKKIITSFLQNIPGWKKLYKVLLPLYPIAFEQYDFTGFDLVISHTTRFAKSIITKPSTTHICYCHTPPRFLWNFSGYKCPKLLQPLFLKLRVYDQVSARRVDHFVAGSKNASMRVKKIYKQNSEVVYPFIDLDRFKNVEPFNGEYFVVIGRKNRYKRFDLAISACLKLEVDLKVIGGGWQKLAIDKVEFMGNLSDRMVVNVLAGARALIVPGEEDFGLTPLEAQALGKPVIAYAAGGALETVIDNKTGILFKEQTVDCLLSAIRRLDGKKIKARDCKENAARFSKMIFLQNFKQVIARL